MNLANGEELMTVKDIARKIAFDRSDDAIARTMRQVRHWTQNDLLRTTSEKHTGKGVPRLYEPEPTVEIAAVLLELTRYGVTVDILKPVAEELWDTDEGMLYRGSAMTDINVYLQASWNSDPITGVFTDAEVNMFDEMDMGPVKTHGEDRKQYTPINSAPSSSILVNMTEVMTRVFVTNAS